MAWTTPYCLEGVLTVGLRGMNQNEEFTKPLKNPSYPISQTSSTLSYYF